MFRVRAEMRRNDGEICENGDANQSHRFKDHDTFVHLHTNILCIFERLNKRK